MGFAFDQTPVNDTDRTARLPDNNRLWLSFGGQYKLSKDGTLDFGYAHLFIKDASINQANPTPPPGNGQLVHLRQATGSSSELIKARSTFSACNSLTASKNWLQKGPMSSPRKRAKASFEERPSGDPVTFAPLDSRLRGNDDIYVRSFCNRF